MTACCAALPQSSDRSVTGVITAPLLRGWPAGRCRTLGRRTSHAFDALAAPDRFLATLLRAHLLPGDNGPAIPPPRHSRSLHGKAVAAVH